jgi:hypothetical protein
VDLKLTILKSGSESIDLSPCLGQKILPDFFLPPNFINLNFNLPNLSKLPLIKSLKLVLILAQRLEFSPQSSHPLLIGLCQFRRQVSGFLRVGLHQVVLETSPDLFQL